MKRNVIRSYLLVLSLLIPLVVGCESIAIETEPQLVFDNLDDNGSVAKKFRLIKNMSSSASGQFSAPELKNLLSAIPADKENVWIIDLRQESHGFINGIPVTWYQYQNRGNVNKTDKQIAAEEAELLAKVRKQQAVEIYTLKKLGGGNFEGFNPITVMPQQVESEQQLVNSLGAHYQRFYVLDHHRPDDQEVDNYISFIKTKLKPEDWLHFHCRGGKGRSSTFMAMYDMVRNAHNTSFDEIMRRQEDMGNIKLDTPQAKTSKLWKADSSRDRYDFLQKFYSYVIDSKGYAARNWSSWLKLHAAK